MELKLSTTRRPLTLSIVGLLVIELLVCCLYLGPEPKSAEAPDVQFSAERAVSIHEELFPPKPHPAGSVENLLVRDRLVELLRNMGWQVEVQTAVVESDAKVAIHNVLARHPATEKLETRPLVPFLHLLSIALGPASGALLCPAFALALCPLYPVLAISAAEPHPASASNSTR